jgi:hypothetical protein
LAICWPFEQQGGRVIVMIVIIHVWLLSANLGGTPVPYAATRRHAERGDAGVGFLLGMVLVAASLVLSSSSGQIVGWAGNALGFLGWLGVPIYSLLLAARVFTDREER